MTFPDRYFDIVLSLGVLEHFEDSVIQRNAILEHMRVLKNDGILLITVPYLSCVRFIIHIPYLKLVSLMHYYKRENITLANIVIANESLRKVRKTM